MSTCTTRVELFHNNTKLVGVVSASTHEISVEMVEPVPGLFSRAYLQRRWAPAPYVYAEGGVLTPEGRAVAERMLVDALDRRLRRAETRALLRELIKRRGAELIAQVEVTRRRVQEELRLQAPVDGETFYTLRRRLRRDLKAGLEQRVYQRRLRQLEERRGAGHRAHRLLLQRVIDHLAPLVPHVADFPDLVEDAGIGIPRCPEALYLPLGLDE